jgi:hypothetical protein
MFFAKVFCLKKSGFTSFLGISGRTGHKNPVTISAVGYGFRADTDVQSNLYVGASSLTRNKADSKPDRVPVGLPYPY